MTSPSTPVPPLLAGLLDDAAIFPPGNAPLAEAVRAHLAHESAPYGGLVGPLVVSAAALAGLAPLVSALGEGSLRLSVTCPEPAAIAGVVAACAALPAVRLVALEVALPADLDAARVLPDLDAALAEAAPSQGQSQGERPEVFVEVPRDGRRLAFIGELASSPYRAKFRTGGVRAELYPGCAELAAAVLACADADLPFKATAGLHHAVRHTDPATGFEQHGFANLLLAAQAALDGAAVADLETILADRDGPSLAARLQQLAPERTRPLRALFRSFGTCSVLEPRDELATLGLIPPALCEGVPA